MSRLTASRWLVALSILLASVVGCKARAPQSATKEGESGAMGSESLDDILARLESLARLHADYVAMGQTFVDEIMNDSQFALDDQPAPEMTPEQVTQKIDLLQVELKARIAILDGKDQSANDRVVAIVQELEVLKKKMPEATPQQQKQAQKVVQVIQVTEQKAQETAQTQQGATQDMTQAKKHPLYEIWPVSYVDVTDLIGFEVGSAAAVSIFSRYKVKAYVQNENSRELSPIDIYSAKKAPVGVSLGRSGIDLVGVTPSGEKFYFKIGFSYTDAKKDLQRTRIIAIDTIKQTGMNGADSAPRELAPYQNKVLPLRLTHESDRQEIRRRAAAARLARVRSADNVDVFAVTGSDRITKIQFWTQGGYGTKEYLQSAVFQSDQAE